jgi:hypothetical protein
MVAKSEGATGKDIVFNFETSVSRQMKLAAMDGPVSGGERFFVQVQGSYCSFCTESGVAQAGTRKIEVVKRSCCKQPDLLTCHQN